MPYIGIKKVKNTVETNGILEIQFENSGDIQYKNLRTSKRFYDFIKTEKQESDAENKMFEKQLKFFTIIILEVLNKDGNFFKDLIDYILSNDKDAFEKRKGEIYSKIYKELKFHNIPLNAQVVDKKFDWFAQVVQETNSVMASRIASLLEWLHYQITLKQEVKTSKLYGESDSDWRTLEDVE